MVLGVRATRSLRWFSWQVSVVRRPRLSGRPDDARALHPPTPNNDNLGRSRAAPSRITGAEADRSRRQLADLEDKLGRCLAALTMHFQPIVHAKDARALRLRGAAALDRQVAAASGRDPRCRRAAREDPGTRPRGARADRQGDRRVARRARRRVHQPSPARSVRQAADVAVRAAVEGREPRGPRDHRAHVARGPARHSLPRRRAARARLPDRDRRPRRRPRAHGHVHAARLPTSSSSTCRSSATSTSTR